MQYTEEHYAQMYNDLPEGLKDLVLSGRLAILVSAIGSRHGLNADQVADLEPAIEDVCLGLITKDELVDNIQKNVNVDQRVANRIAAEAELEILRPFEAELVIARKQKEDLDVKITGGTSTKKTFTKEETKTDTTKNKLEPKDVSDHAPDKKVSDWYQKGEEGNKDNKSATSGKVSFDWDSDFAKKPTPKEEPVVAETNKDVTQNISSPNIENKLDQLTESINKLIDVRFGSPDKKDDTPSAQMQELLKRLEQAEKENAENKKLIRNLQSQKTSSTPIENIFGDASKIQIDKQRKVDIDHTEPKKDDQKPSGNIQITTTSKAIPIQKDLKQEVISSTVSKDTLDSIVEIRNKSDVKPDQNISTKKAFSLDELVSKSDDKIKSATQKATPGNGTLVFPGLNDEKKIDIKNINQKDSIRETLLSDLDFLTKKGADEMTDTQTKNTEKTDTNPPQTGTAVTTTTTDTGSDIDTEEEKEVVTPDTQGSTQGSNTNPFKDELLPKTKEERMKALQDKINALNKGVSVDGKTNITASGLDPYRL